MATLVRWAPSPVHTELNRLFGSVFAPYPYEAPQRRFVPATDLTETEYAYVVKADLPGLTAADVKIEVDGGVLTVSGERKTESDETKGAYRRVERSYGRFSRSLRLPKGVSAESITAKFANGVLEVSIPKPEQVAPHTVEITGADETPAVEAPAAE
jgi:HSP20 family protein